MDRHRLRQVLLVVGFSGERHDDRAGVMPLSTPTFASGMRLGHFPRSLIEAVTDGNS